MLSIFQQAKIHHFIIQILVDYLFNRYYNMCPAFLNEFIKIDLEKT